MAEPAAAAAEPAAMPIVPTAEPAAAAPDSTVVSEEAAAAPDSPKKVTPTAVKLATETAKVRVATDGHHRHVRTNNIDLRSPAPRLCRDHHDYRYHTDAQLNQEFAAKQGKDPLAIDSEPIVAAISSTRRQLMDAAGLAEVGTMLKQTQFSLQYGVRILKLLCFTFKLLPLGVRINGRNHVPSLKPSGASRLRRG